MVYAPFLQIQQNLDAFQEVFGIDGTAELIIDHLKAFVAAKYFLHNLSDKLLILSGAAAQHPASSYYKVIIQNPFDLFFAFQLGAAVHIHGVGYVGFSRRAVQSS